MWKIKPNKREMWGNGKGKSYIGDSNSKKEGSKRRDGGLGGKGRKERETGRKWEGEKASVI